MQPELANAKDERIDRARELVAPFLRVEVGGNRLHRPVVDVELTVWVPAGRNQQQRTAPRTVQLGFVDRHRLTRKVREHRQRIAELACIDAAQHICDRVGHG